MVLSVERTYSHDWSIKSSWDWKWKQNSKQEKSFPSESTWSPRCFKDSGAGAHALFEALATSKSLITLDFTGCFQSLVLFVMQQVSQQICLHFGYCGWISSCIYNLRDWIWCSGLCCFSPRTVLCLEHKGSIIAERSFWRTAIIPSLMYKSRWCKSTIAQSLSTRSKFFCFQYESTTDPWNFLSKHANCATFESIRIPTTAWQALRNAQWSQLTDANFDWCRWR